MVEYISLDKMPVFTTLQCECVTAVGVHKDKLGVLLFVEVAVSVHKLIIILVEVFTHISIFLMRCYFVPQPRVAKVEKPETVERDMSPRKFSEDIQYFHQNGSMVVDNGQVGFLSEVRKNGAIFTPLPIKPEQEKRAMLYITLSETYPIFGVGFGLSSSVLGCRG